MGSDGDLDRYQVKRQPFGRWLLEQHMRGDWVVELAMAPRGDRSFPKDGDAEGVRKHLRAQHGDVFQALDDAENELGDAGQ